MSFKGHRHQLGMNQIIMFWSNFVWEYFPFGSSRTVQIQTKIYFVAIPLTYQTAIPHPFVASKNSWSNLIVVRSTFELARVLGLVVIRRGHISWTSHESSGKEIQGRA